MKNNKEILTMANDYVNEGINWLIDKYEPFYGKTAKVILDKDDFDALDNESINRLINNIEKNPEIHNAWYDNNEKVLCMKFTTEVKYVENAREYNDNFKCFDEYRIIHYYYKKDNEFFLSKVWYTECNIDVDVATTVKDYELEDIGIDDDNCITKKEFKLLYKKLKNQFEIDMFK